MIYAVIAFAMFIIFDFNKIIWNDKRLNMLFMLGILILAYGSYDCFIKGKTLLWIAERVKGHIFFVVAAVFGIWKTCSVLFVELPFDETYAKTGKLPLVDTGAYGKCRHPGFWFLLIASVSLCITFFSFRALMFTITVNLLNLLYIYIEDEYVFPKTIYRYDEYKKRVPFLVPKI